MLNRTVIRRLELRIWAPLLLVAVLFGVAARHWGRSAYLLSYPFLVRTLPPIPRPDPRVVVVELDDATLEDPRIAKWGPSAISRREHARVVRELAVGGARVVGWDLAFIGEVPEDREFRAALDGKSAGGGSPPPQVLVLDARANTSEQRGDRFEMPSPELLASPQVRLASPMVRRHAASGVVLGPVLEQSLPDGRTLSGLAFECWKAATGQDDLDASHRFAVAADGRILMVWPRQASGAFPHVSYRDVWDGAWKRRSPDLFRGRVVLVGSTVTGGTADVLKTPRGPMPGVYVHAHAVQTLLDRSELTAGWLGTWVLCGLAGGLALLAAHRLRPLAAFVSILALAAAGFGVAVLALRAPFHYWLDPLQPAAAALVFGGYRLLWQSSVTRRMLELFAGSEAAEQLVQHERIASRSLDATILFADVRGYTDLAEQLSPAELMDVLNEHYRWLDAVIARHGGRVDKHIGDAMMAVFEGVRDGKSHAERALDSAAEMLRRAPERGGRSAELQFGIGVHTGAIVIGTLGQEKREYGTVGDAVNVAARLQQSTRLAGVAVLVSEETARAAGCEERLRRLEPLSLKGKSEPVVVYTLPDSAA